MIMDTVETNTYFTLILSKLIPLKKRERKW